MRRLLYIGLAALVAAGCPRAPESPRPQRGDGEARTDSAPSLDALARDLEATVLENFMQLSLGNMDAWANGLARSREVVLLGISADETAVGRRRTRGRGADRRLYRKLSPAIYSKTLDVHLSQEGGVGWTFDEVSYRVPYQGRQASIPVRVTGIFVRDIDRWMMVQEHMSYAIPTEDLRLMARNGDIASPGALRPRGSGNMQVDRLLERAVMHLHNGDERQRRRVLSDEPDALIVMPDPDHEFRGAGVTDAPPLSSVYGDEARVELDGRRISLARAGTVAWMVANLGVHTTVDDESVVVPLRATYLFELRGDFGWEVVQAHISAPVDEREVSRRVFGGDITPGR